MINRQLQTKTYLAYNKRTILDRQSLRPQADICLLYAGTPETKKVYSVFVDSVPGSCWATQFSTTILNSGLGSLKADCRGIQNQCSDWSLSS